MHFSTLIPVAFAVLPLVSASGKLGFALGDKKADGTCKFQADYESDFDTIGTVSKIVRVYAASDCNTAQEILPAAKSKGFQVILGIWYVVFVLHDCTLAHELMIHQARYRHLLRR